MSDAGWGSATNGGGVPPDGRVIAITGARTFLGTELIRRLEEDERYERIIALDIRPPELPLEKTEFHTIDLTVPAIDRKIASIVRKAKVDTLVHTAFLSYPTHATAWAHELEDVGTMHVLNACADISPARLILASTTMVYGASARNPNCLEESAELKGHRDSRFINDKVRAEQQFEQYADEHPETVVTSLRFAPTIGPTINNFFTRFFSRPVAPVLMGHDPLLQFLHQSDAIRALELALDRAIAGPLNIVGKGVLPYTTVLAMMGRVPLPMPHRVARALSRALWATQVFDSPPSFLDFLRYVCVADGKRAREALDFRPSYDIIRTINDFLGVRPDEDAPEVARAQG